MDPDTAIVRINHEGDVSRIYAEYEDLATLGWLVEHRKKYISPAEYLNLPSVMQQWYEPMRFDQYDPITGYALRPILQASINRYIYNGHIARVITQATITADEWRGLPNVIQSFYTQTNSVYKPELTPEQLSFLDTMIVT